METMKPDLPLLHLHAQEQEHAEAWVVGNRAGLVALRDALDRALAMNVPTSAHAFVNDGEGFALIVIPDDSPWLSPAWTQAARPYTDAIAVNNIDALMPWRRLAAGEYKRLAQPLETDTTP